MLLKFICFLTFNDKLINAILDSGTCKINSVVFVHVKQIHLSYEVCGRRLGDDEMNDSNYTLLLNFVTETE